MKRLKTLWQLFISMFKIGLFTFGGGYAMIHILENEFVSKKQWLESDEFIDLVAIAESTPGPIAINCSTYIGFKKEKILGAVFSTIGMVLPSLCIIYCISLFFNQFLSIAWIAAAFKGIQVCVIYLILSAGVKMWKGLKKSVFHITVVCVVVLVMVAFSLFAVKVSTIVYILVSGVAGLSLYFFGKMRKGEAE
jgi:chromate transporter